MIWKYETYSMKELMAGDGAPGCLESLGLPKHVQLAVVLAHLSSLFGRGQAAGADGKMGWQFDPPAKAETFTLVRLPWDLWNLHGDQRLDALDDLTDAPPEIYPARAAIARELVNVAQRLQAPDLADLEAYATAAGASPRVKLPAYSIR